jgi:hypothetical protein
MMNVPVNPDIKKLRLELKFYDFNPLPKDFKTPQDCINTYNDMCYKHEVQWRFGHCINETSFIIECPFSVMCPVRIKFNWNKHKLIFHRESGYAIFHDHCLQRCDLLIDPKLKEKVQEVIRQTKKKVTATELADQFGIQPFEATHLLRTTPILDFFGYDD